MSKQPSRSPSYPVKPHSNFVTCRGWFASTRLLIVKHPAGDLTLRLTFFVFNVFYQNTAFKRHKLTRSSIYHQAATADMNPTLAFLLLSTLAFRHCTAIQARHINSSESHQISKRTYSEHWSLPNPVKNCSDPQWTLEVLPNTTASISVADCRKVLENARYNKGYYEVWGFDSENYMPVTGYQSCVVGVARMDTVVTKGYAVWVPPPSSSKKQRQNSL